MLLGYHIRFAEFLLAGAKTHTIRAYRKDGRRPKVGERLYHYTGLRTKKSNKLGESTCLRTADIVIARIFGNIRISIDQTLLTEDEILALVKRDGFESLQAFTEYWSVQTLPFEGMIIYWDKLEPVA